MLTRTSLFADLTDDALTETVRRLAHDERHATVQLVASLVEFDARRLYLGAGCASLFAYCTRVLQLSEHAAYHRIEAARAARRFPIVLQGLADGSMTLTNLTLLAPHLTADNAATVLAAARHKSKREVERQVAALAPRPDLPSSIRRLPAPARTTDRPMASPPADAILPAPLAPVTPIAAKDGILQPARSSAEEKDPSMTSRRHRRPQGSTRSGPST